MKPAISRSIPVLFRNLAGATLAVLLIFVQGCTTGPTLKPWHTEKLTEEFTADMLGMEVRRFDDYLALEERLFRELDEKVYARTPTGPAHALERYSRGSAADPHRWPTDWNRTFELHASSPVGGILLLHGMSDSPYSLRALGEALNRHGYEVVGLRLPGHGTAPSALRTVTREDMAAAVRLAMEHLATRLETRPVHVVGYSTGGPLALEFALNALDDGSLRLPASIVLISPAIRVHAAGALAGIKDAMARLPGLGGLAWLTVMDEFDPYKYNSFATNAATQVHRITSDVDARIRALSRDQAAVAALPPVLVLKSTVDSTVTTEAVVDNLLMRLPADRNELVLFDINRNAAIKSTLLVSDPGPLTRRLLDDDSLPFAVTFVTNEDPHSTRVVARHKAPFSRSTQGEEALNLAWPAGVVSLSHVALPFPPDDPLYGRNPPENSDLVYLGQLAIKGERGLLKLPADWLLRLRHNPFYAFLEQRVLEWVDAGGALQDI